MPRGSFAHVFRDWESLQAACQANVRELPELDTCLSALTASLNEVREIKAVQEDLRGKGQGTTQQLNAAVERGEEAARRLRGYVKARMGTKTEFLVQFGISPIRSRSRTRKTPGGPATPPPQPPAPTE
ncbi:MAG TPA: hypothetical protein VF414_00825 [Thermoanaerobaculia bacterium]